jgi:hypothetical protein
MQKVYSSTDAESSGKFYCGCHETVTGVLLVATSIQIELGSIPLVTWLVDPSEYVQPGNVLVAAQSVAVKSVELDFDGVRLYTPAMT